jgi:phosphatidate cytidylyltransferase
MKTRVLVAVIFVPLLFVVMFFLPSIALTLVVMAICAVASYELVKSTKASVSLRIYIYAAVSAAIIPLGWWLGYGDDIFMGALFLLMVLTFTEAIAVYGTEKEMHFSTVLAVLFGGAVIPGFLSALVRLRLPENGKYLVLLPFIVAFVADGGAYFAGVFLGKHRVTKVSPKKSIEGFIGGYVAAVLALIIYGVIIKSCAGFQVNFLYLVIYGVLGSFVTQVGDLAFSLIKRQLDIKDYGNLLPGHGGMLDRFDSMVFCAPLIFFLVEYLPAIIK